MCIRADKMLRRLVLLVLFATARVAAQDLLLVQGEQSEVLSREDLSNLATVELITDTPWTTEPAIYTGVRLQTLTKQLPDSDSPRAVRLVALNDYAVTADLEMLMEADATLVFERNGEPMAVRDYGPYWLLFPFSDRPELSRSEIRDVSVWQLQRMEFLP